MTLTERSNHLAWCALVAFALARQNDGMLLAAQGNLFFTRWLTTALKQRRFSRGVAPNTERPLKQGRQPGISAKLAGKLNYLQRFCTNELTEQNDLLRLTYALETARDAHWSYRLLSDREWSGRNAMAPGASADAIYLSRVNLDVAFSGGGRQIGPLTARLTGNVTGVMELFNRCGWQTEPEFGASLPHQHSLMAGQGAPGKGD